MPQARGIRELRGWLRQLVPTLRPPPASLSDERAFRAYCAGRMRSQCDLALVVSCAFTILWWPTDVWILGGLGVVGTFAGMRGLILGLAVVYLLLVHATRLGRHPLAVFASVGVAMLFAIGVAMAELGPPDQPWLYFSYVFPFVTVALPLTPWPRVALTVAFAVAGVAGAFVHRPDYLASPYAPMMLSFLVAVMLVSVAAGQTLFVGVREAFLRSRELARLSAEVQDYCEHLEDKVSARTGELRRLLAHLETAREDERAFISRELHDQLGQELTAQRYALAFTRRRYQEDPGAIARNLTELEELQARIAATVRSIVTTLRPVVLDDQGLRAALEWLVRQTGERTGVEVRLTVDGDEARLTGEQPIALYRIVQESLTNALRHAGPTRVTVALGLGADAVELSISDDGGGFDPAAVVPGARAGAGLIGMRERAHGLGGELVVDSSPGRGTTVRVRLPLAPAAASPPRRLVEAPAAPAAEVAP